MLVGWQKWHSDCKTEWWGASIVICLERCADLHMAQLMPLPFTVSCFSKIQIGFTFLVPTHLGSPVQRAIKRVCVYQCLCRSNIRPIHNPHKLNLDLNRNTKNIKIIKIAIKNANLCGKICDMCILLKYAKNVATCKICRSRIFA